MRKMFAVDVLRDLEIFKDTIFHVAVYVGKCVLYGDTCINTKQYKSLKRMHPEISTNTVLLGTKSSGILSAAFTHKLASRS